MFDPAGYVGTMYLSAPVAEVTPVPADVLPADQLVDVVGTMFSVMMPLIVLTIIWQVISYAIRPRPDVKVKTVYKTVEGFTPAYAGNILLTHRCSRQTKVHPRVCGEYAQNR